MGFQRNAGSWYLQGFLACSLLACVSGPAAANANFSAPISSLSTPNPGQVAVADFDGDGHLDAVVADPVQGVVAFQHGNGDGTFAAPITELIGGEPEEVETADLNGDGKADIIVGDAQNAAVTVALGNGDGTFTISATLAIGPALHFHVVDFNHDGIPDLVVVSYNSSTIELYPGNGDGTFGTPTTVTLGFLPLDAAVGDVNGDGLPDLVICDESGGRLAVVLQTAPGVFGTPSYLATQQLPASLDLVPDASSGFLDIVVSEANADVPQGWVEVFTGSSGGQFASSHLYPIRADSYLLPGVDLNGDGIPDLVLGSNFDDSVTVLLGQSGGVYGSQMTYRVGYTPFGETVGDVDGDGHPDIISTSSFSGTISVQHNGGAGIFDSPWEYIGPQVGSPHTTPIDLDGDGLPDMIVPTTVTQSGVQCSAVVLQHNDGQGGFTSGAQSILNCNPSVGFTVSPPYELVDMNGDGIPDIVAIGRSGNSTGVGVALGNGDGTFATAKVSAGSSPADEYIDFVVGDLNGDGRPDVVINNKSAAAAIYLQQADGSFTHLTDVPVTGTATATVVEQMRIADLAQNGHPDLIVADVFMPEIRVYPFTGTGLGTPTHYALNNTITGSAALAVVDVNGDHYPDLIVSSKGGIGVLLNDGTGNFGPEHDYPSGSYCSSMATADVDGDGNLDVACMMAGNGQFVVYYGHGDGTFTAGPITSGFEGDDSIFIADMNGDGKPDIVMPSEFTYPPSPLLNFDDPYPEFDIFYQKPTSGTLPPLTVPEHFFTKLGQPVEVPLLGLDRSGAAVTLSIVTLPAHGTLAASPTNSQDFIYTPDVHYWGYDSFTYKAGNANGATINMVEIQTLDTNKAPTSVAAYYSLRENQTLTGTLAGSDSDGDAVSFSINQAPTHGKMTVTDASTGAFTYVPDHDYVGTDLMSFQACDWEFCGGAILKLSIKAPGGGDGVPVTEPMSIVVTQGQTFTGALLGSDADNDGLSYSVTTPPLDGTLIITNPTTGAFTYKAKPGFTGPDSFTYKVTDGAFSTLGSVRVQVSPAPPSGGGTPPPTSQGGGGGTLGFLDLLGLLYLAVRRKRPGKGIGS